MRALILDEAAVDAAFAATLDKLGLQRWSTGVQLDPKTQFENSPIGEMHRAFHFEVCRLKTTLKEMK